MFHRAIKGKNMEIIIIIVGCLILYLNVAASIYLYKSIMYTSGQKIAQSLIIWLIPIIGAAIVLNVLMEEVVQLKKHDSSAPFLLRVLTLTIFFEAASGISQGEAGSHDGGYESGGFDGGGGDSGGGGGD